MVPWGASSGVSAMKIDVPANTGNRLTNELGVETWSLDYLADGGGSSTHGMIAETCDDFEELRSKCVEANLDELRVTKEVTALASTGLDHGEADLQSAAEVVMPKGRLYDLKIPVKIAVASNAWMRWINTANSTRSSQLEKEITDLRKAAIVTDKRMQIFSREGVTLRIR